MRVIDEILGHLDYFLNRKKNKLGEKKAIRDMMTNVSNIFIQQNQEIIGRLNAGVGGGGGNGMVRSRTYMGDGKLLIELEFGWICIHTANLDVGTGIVKNGLIEPWNTELLHRILKPDDTYINVGANFGYFTILAGAIVGTGGKVLSFEANPTIYSCLCTGIFYSGFPSRIDAYNLAASNSVGEADFIFNPVFSGGGSLIYSSKPTKEQLKTSIDDCKIEKEAGYYTVLRNGGWDKYPYLSFDVKTTTLDTVVASYKGTDKLKNISLLHMDVEGAECLVLDGGQNLLKEHKPIIIMEFDSMTLSHDFQQFEKEQILKTFKFLMDELKYAVYHIVPKTPLKFEKVKGIKGLYDLPHGDLLLVQDESLITKLEKDSQPEY